MLRVLPVCFNLMLCFALHAQMKFKSQILYGNEWIQPGRDYYKIKIAEDGIYKINYQQLQQAGIPINSLTADQIRLIKFGSEVEMIRSTPGIMGIADYLLFYGKKNRSELDEPLM